MDLGITHNVKIPKVFTNLAKVGLDNIMRTCSVVKCVNPALMSWYKAANDEIKGLFTTYETPASDWLRFFIVKRIVRKTILRVQVNTSKAVF